MTKRSLLPTSVILCLVTLYATSTAAKRIIFMPFPITSTAYIHVEIAHAMLDRGHQVWLVVPDIVAQKKVLNTEGMTVIQYHTRYSVEDDIVSEFFLKSFLEYRSLPFADATERILATTHDTLSNKELFEELKAVQADLFVFDDQDCISKMFVVFPYRLGVPFVGTDFQLQPFSRRVPFSPATLPAFMTETSHHLTLKERVQNTLIHLLQLVYTPWQIPDAVARYAPEMPYISLDRLVARAELWLLQIDPIVQFPYPTVPNVKHIGCIPASPAKPLDSKFQSFMDKAKDGAMVVTFGSMVKNLPQNITDKLMAAFLKLRPLKVVVRIDVTSPDPEQILTSSWVPQNSLLAHRNCRVFVTHCGISGLQQGVFHGVPMLGLPMFYDQHQNAALLQYKGYGVRMDIRQVSAEELADAIRMLIQEPRYKHTVTKASNLVQELYGDPVTSAAYWLDHVMKYGGDYMRSSGQEMPLYQFLLLDVVGILAGSLGVIMVLVYCCVTCMCRRFCKTKVKRE